ncbi:MAG: sigma 54-interacting transcriptional regulator [Spirochaetales bacterium]|nr:sigma 54-interacting transcriptional regulator [Spirochaetales bacterium]
MINLIFIVPYEELRPLVEEVLEEYKPDEQIIPSICVFKTWEIGGVSFPGDVIISRGFTAQILKKQYPDLICVPLKISGYDIIHAVNKAMRMYRPRKIGLIGSYLMVYNIENLRAIFDIEIITYPVDNIDDTPAALDKSRRDGCDCFIGGLSLMACCSREDRAVMIETGKAAIIQTLDEAVRLTLRTRIERNRAAGLRTIINHSRQGVVFIDEAGTITAVNETAARYLQADKGWIGRKGREALPFLSSFLDEVERTGADLTSEIITVADQLLAIDFIPAVHEHSTVGIILFIQSVSRIQKDESLIRKKIHSKGLKAKYTFADILCTGGVFDRALNQARQFSQVESPILITGESGTGKELLAQGIHNASPRRDGPFVAINCAALPENLLESELFGYSEGAFTGALKGGKPGLFELAHGGSLFLDEISEIPVSFQSKLLRVLQENEVRRIGDDKVLSIDIRVITATNRDLRDLVRRGLFRRDLLFRLDVLAVNIPPLRERPGDIIDLFDRYIAEFSRKYHKEIVPVSGEAKQLLRQHSWEGNVRELRNIAERICVLNDSRTIIGGDIVRETLYGPAPLFGGPAGEACPAPLAEEEVLLSLIEKYAGHKGRIAAHLGIDRSTLWRKLRKYRIQN